MKNYLVNVKIGGHMSVGIPEIILIAVVVLLLFGGKRIPELARSLGRAQHEYKKAKKALKEEAEELSEAASTIVENDSRKSSEEESKREDETAS